MQLCRIIVYSLAAVHVASVIFAHHQEHLNYLQLLVLHTYTVCCCRLVSLESWNVSFVKIMLTKVTLARSISALPDDGDYTETCWSYFNVNFNVNFIIVVKTIQLCIRWQTNKL
jgi:hypothetical protein